MNVPRSSLLKCKVPSRLLADSSDEITAFLRVVSAS